MLSRPRVPLHSSRPGTLHPIHLRHQTPRQTKQNHRRLTPTGSHSHPYDALSEFVDDDAQEEEEMDTYPPPQPDQRPNPRLPTGEGQKFVPPGLPKTRTHGARNWRIRRLLPRSPSPRRPPTRDQTESQVQTPTQTHTVRPRIARPYCGRSPTTLPTSVDCLQGRTPRTSRSGYQRLHPDCVTALRNQ